MKTEDKKEDDTYKFGLLYKQETDKRLFVPKASGMGYTLNFGNKWSYLVLAVILGSVVFVIVYGYFFQK